MEKKKERKGFVKSQVKTTISSNNEQKLIGNKVAEHLLPL